MEGHRKQLLIQRFVNLSISRGWGRDNAEELIQLRLCGLVSDEDGGQHSTQLTFTTCVVAPTNIVVGSWDWLVVSGAGAIGFRGGTWEEGRQSVAEVVPRHGYLLYQF